MDRIRTSGKFFRLGRQKWWPKGFSYGPFAPNRDQEFLPDRLRVQSDFALMRQLGANALRVYHPPPCWFLDDALEYDLRVFVDIPWDKHRCFFEDWSAQQEAVGRVRDTARTIGGHSAVLAISVANEFPNDIVRFYGRRRIERFVSKLLDTVKQEAPDCLATFVNYPTTEFLQPSGCDFFCQNVYLHDPQLLGKYLDRLQHIAAHAPLVLGEYGIDSLGEGEEEQARLLSQHVRQVFQRGLAGSFVFSFTDDWYTGGCQIEDWAFGVTRRDRSPKPAATVLGNVWSTVPTILDGELPPVSIVVCSYNGAATLRECLHSLMQLDYPQFEVVLVDDGSTDSTPEIAAEFPQVRYLRQENKGLSIARNVGAEAATGEIVAYTDSDCMVDEDWLTYLVRAMQDQQVDAIGGPNLPPPSDSWVAKCVAASPGGPSHVMLDDRYAEHVPGCNMAFRRENLLYLGGFDPQFHQAGDDVDMCWRWLDAEMRIGYAPAAMVWHHRRPSVRGYLRQQRGYGRSEAMVHFKHPQRFDALGKSSWMGVIYGDGAVGLPVLPPRIYHGRFGSAPFQTIYRKNEYSPWAWVVTIEWHVLALFMLLLGALVPWLCGISLAMWSATLGVTVRAALDAPMPKNSPGWARPLVWWLYFIQPIVRGWTRHTYLLGAKKLPTAKKLHEKTSCKRISATVRDLYWDNSQGQGREQLLEALLDTAKKGYWSGDFDNSWAPWDVKLVGDCWHDIEIHTATEELGWPRRFTRARCRLRSTFFARIAVGACLVWAITSVLSAQLWGLMMGLIPAGVLLLCLIRSRHRCLSAVIKLAWTAGEVAGLSSGSPQVDDFEEPVLTAPAVTSLPAVSLESQPELAAPFVDKD